MLTPEGNDREGYVPNVVYSCGGLAHNNLLILPYAVSDTSTRIATVQMEPLLDALTTSRAARLEPVAEEHR